MSNWTVRKRAGALLPGDRFIFDAELGGEGETLTVEYILSSYGAVEIYTGELDFAINTTSTWMLTMAGVSDADEDPPVSIRSTWLDGKGF
ncbi:MAG TPA: hypothetical protein DEP82_14845 [Arthrobacter bacterium]|nr:hypothetical protein [Arthrobacter sp.]